MNKWMTTTAVLVACGACFMAGHVFAQEDGGGAGAAPQMPAWTQMGPEHASMKKSAGDWDVAQKFWMAPGQPPMEFKASSTAALLWDGRFVTSEFRGDFMGTPFEGRLLMGFDGVDKEYVAVWIDSTSTYMSVSRGKDVDGAIAFQMNDPDWVTGEKVPKTMTMKWVDDDTYTLTFAEAGPDGEPFTQMVMTYTRKKSEK